MTLHQHGQRFGGHRSAVSMSRPVQSRSGFYRDFGKRVLDIALIVLFAPPVLLVVLVLAFFVGRDGSPAFYRQKRVGRNGEIFWILKLRSMVPDADAALEAHLADNPAARAEWDRTQKLRNDPRVTPLGRILRKTSLDELPQLWNVVRGDMSLVGPRPMMPCQRELYSGTAYYKLRPGITGFWQVSARNDASFAERAEFDTTYYEDLSFDLDLRVLMRTIGVVLRGTGC